MQLDVLNPNICTHTKRQHGLFLCPLRSAQGLASCIPACLSELVFDAWGGGATAPHPSLNMSAVSHWHMSPCRPALPSLLQRGRTRRAVPRTSLSGRSEMAGAVACISWLCTECVHVRASACVCACVWDGRLSKVFLSIIRAWLVLR